MGPLGGTRAYEEVNAPDGGRCSRAGIISQQINAQGIELVALARARPGVRGAACDEDMEAEFGRADLADEYDLPSRRSCAIGARKTGDVIEGDVAALQALTGATKQLRPVSTPQQHRLGPMPTQVGRWTSMPRPCKRLARTRARALRYHWHYKR